MAEPARIHFREELTRLEERTLEGLDMAVDAIGRAVEACAHQDIELAEIVIADDDRIDGRYLEVHQGILTLLATQAPVASDLRLVAALLHVVRHMERIGDQCVTVSKLVPLTGHDPPVREGMLKLIQRMGEQARQQVRQARKAFEQRDVEMAHDLVRQDDEIDELNREVFQMVIDIGEERDTREWAMTMLLIARALERVGDNAVDIGEQTAFVVTGLFQEFEDASRAAAPPPAPES